MDEQFYNICLAGYQFSYRLKNQESMKWFGWHLEPVCLPSDNIIELSDEMLRSRRDNFDPDVPEDYIEYRLLVNQTSLLLSAHNRFLIHAVAFIWKGFAWLLSAPSGTGKTTHVKKWLKKIPGSFIVNGDKPYIDVKKKLVYGSPWCGKEGMNTNTSIPLCGIISLERGEMNNITLISYQEMLKVYLQQVYIPDDPETAVKAYQLIGMLKNVPCYRLICNMEEESAQVAYQGLCGDYDRELFI